MKKLITTTIITLLCAYCTSVLSKAPIKFGKPSMEELQMSVYEPDTSASAVVLCDYGYFDANQFSFTRILRIKILKKDGLEHANQVFPSQFKSSVSGFTMNLVNGEIVKEKLKNDNIAVEKIVDDFTRTRVAMPNVKVGSVIDFRIGMEGVPFKWYFQREIPIKLSTIYIPDHQYIDYSKRIKGNFVSFSERTNSLYTVKNIPAFVCEPYSLPQENYLARLEIELERISYPGFYKEYNTTWGRVGGMLMSHNRFGEAIYLPASLKGYINELKAELTDPTELLKAVYSHIKEIKWNNVNSIYVSSDGLSKVYNNNKVGNSAEINLLLYKALEVLKYEASIIITSTRENGRMNNAYPSMGSVNYAFVKVELGDKHYYLDATEENLPIGYLPIKAINGHGQEIRPKAKTINDVNIEIDKGKDRRFYASLALDEEGAITGDINGKLSYYSAYFFRNYYKEFTNEEAYLERFEEDHEGYFVIENTINNLDDIYSPIKTNTKIEITSKTEKSGNLLMLYPMVISNFDENPFKSPKRKYPVDLIFNTSFNYTAKVTLPNGYEVQSLPENYGVKLPDNGGIFTFKAIHNNNVLQIAYNFKLTKNSFNTIEYEQLRAFIENAIVKQEEPVVLKKL